MRKLYNVDLPVPSSIQLNNYTTHIIFANNSLDADSQSDIDLNTCNLDSPPTNNNINKTTHTTSALPSSFSFNFSNRPISLIQSLKNQLSLSSLNRTSLSNSRKSSSGSSTSSNVSLNSLSNISNAKLSTGNCKSAKQGMKANYFSYNNNKANNDNGFSNIIDSSQTERYFIYSKSVHLHACLFHVSSSVKHYLF